MPNNARADVHTRAGATATPMSVPPRVRLEAKATSPVTSAEPQLDIDREPTVDDDVHVQGGGGCQSCCDQESEGRRSDRAEGRP